jgi:hypothetical protein
MGNPWSSCGNSEASKDGAVLPVGTQNSATPVDSNKAVLNPTVGERGDFTQKPALEAPTGVVRSDTAGGKKNGLNAPTASTQDDFVTIRDSLPTPGVNPSQRSYVAALPIDEHAQAMTSSANVSPVKHKMGATTEKPAIHDSATSQNNYVNHQENCTADTQAETAQSDSAASQGGRHLADIHEESEPYDDDQNRRPPPYTYCRSQQGRQFYQDSHILVRLSAASSKNMDSSRGTSGDESSLSARSTRSTGESRFRLTQLIHAFADLGDAVQDEIDSIVDLFFRLTTNRSCGEQSVVEQGVETILLPVTSFGSSITSGNFSELLSGITFLTSANIV